MAGDQHTRRRFAWLDSLKGDQRLAASAFKVAYEVAVHLNRGTGAAWPSYRTMADALGMSVPNVVKMVGQLKACGYLEIESGKAGRGHSNRYRPVVPNTHPSELFPTPNTHPGEHLDQENTHPDECLPEGEKLTGVNRKAHPVKLKAHQGEQNPLNNPLREPFESISVKNDDELFPKEPSKPNGQPNGKLTIGKHFEAFWAQCPRKVGKQAAFKAYQAVIKKKLATPEELLGGILRYSAERDGQDPQYTRHPSSWLAGGHWADEPSPKTNAYTKPAHGRPASNVEAAMKGYDFDE